MSYWRFIRDHRRILAFGFVHEFCSGPGQTFCISLFVASFAASFGASPAELGSAYLAATLAAAFVLPQIGFRIDRIGLRGYSLGAATLLMLASLLTASAPNLLVLGIGLFGLRLAGQGLLVHLGTTATARAFTHERGRALGITALGMPLAQALYPALAVVLIALIGWRWSYAIIGFGTFAVLVPCALWLVPADRPIDPAQTPANGRETGWRSGPTGALLSSGFFWAALPMLFVASFVGTAIIFQLTVIAEIRGWSSVWVAVGFGVLALAQIAALFWSGRIIDRYSTRWLAALHAVPITLAVVVLAVFQQPSALLVAMLGIGVSSGAARTAFTAVWAEVYGTQHLGAIRSLVMSVMVVASAIAPFSLGLAFTLAPNLSIALFGLAAAAGLFQLPLVVFEVACRRKRAR